MIGEKQLKVFLENVEYLSSSYMTSLDEAEAKLDNIIETSQFLQVKLLPQARIIDQYQLALQNMELCRDELMSTQRINRTSLEVHSIISSSPSGNLDQYLEALDKVKTAIEYFKSNDSLNPELKNLEALSNLGNESIEKEFEALLNQAFPIVRPDHIFSLCFTKDTDSESVSSLNTVNTDIFDNVAESHESELRKLSQWILKDGSLKCIVKYCVCRRESLRTTMGRFKEWCRNNPNIEHGNITMRNRTTNSKTAKRKTMSKKSANLMKEGHKRQVSEYKEEFEEREATLFSIQLVALVKLMKNERAWIEKLNLTSNYNDKCGAMDSIVKGSINDFLNDGDDIMKMMNRAQAKHQYHYVINIILILERFIEVKLELREILEILMEHTRKTFFNMLSKLSHIVYQCLEVYSSYIETEKITGTNGNYIPDDATVHELTTNTLRFLETLLMHGDITENVLANVSLSEKIMPHKREVGAGHSKSGNFQIDSKGKNPLFEYISRVIEALLKNMFNISLSYGEDLAKVIFQINNAHYIMKTLETPEFYGTYHSLSQGFKDVSKTLAERKMFYVVTFLRTSNLPDKQHYSGFLTTSTKVDNTTKVHLKDMWLKFNDSFKMLVRLHRQFVVPDHHLRSSLINELKSSFLPRYVEFREKFWNFPFTTKRDKYIPNSKEDIEKSLDQFFVQ